MKLTPIFRGDHDIFFQEQKIKICQEMCFVSGSSSQDIMLLYETEDLK